MHVSNDLLHTEVLETDLHSHLQNPDASFLLALWSLARGAGDIPSEQQMPAAQLARLSPQMMILCPDGPEDWIYESYGDEIARHAGFDMTGRRVSHFQGPVGAFFRALYGRVTRERAPLGSVHRFGPERSGPLWERLILPAGDATSVSRLYVVNRVREPALDRGHPERRCVLAAD
jgi:hypothetical protein